ncbi:hypothetical protein [Desulfofustis limnaeus]|uniref:Uncharacterized protein n=1 Tax=Desulfofustis limnaeus TaxID=2740163 RepID=A0ABM7W7N9_9BACT|nr:hypothetical protein [Desulfofustis limnaeus]BDD87031.1 hypothetical protein DPPLL_13960 [Desulfofustis limnaeus]
MAYQELGRLLTAPKAAKQIGIGVKKFRKHYARFGGFVLDGRTYVYEEILKHALQDTKKWSMDGAGDDRREKTTAPVQNEKRSAPVGGGAENGIDISASRSIPDLHDVFGRMGK